MQIAAYATYHIYATQMHIVYLLKAQKILSLKEVINEHFFVYCNTKFVYIKYE